MEVVGVMPGRYPALRPPCRERLYITIRDVIGATPSVIIAASSIIDSTLHVTSAVSDIIDSTLDVIGAASSNIDSTLDVISATSGIIGALHFPALGVSVLGRTDLPRLAIRNTF
jgi:hypothetical protein